MTDAKKAADRHADAELEDEQAVDLPNREAMSLIGGAGVLGGPPTVASLFEQQPPDAPGPASIAPEPEPPAA
jgi:hypothetical protein